MQDEHIIKQLIYLIGDSPDREGLKDTPSRVVKAYKEIYYGYDKSQKPKLTVFPNNTDGIDYDQIITDTGSFNSTCEHHMMSFIGRYYFGYIPRDKVIGLSKVARVVDYCSARLQIQERLTKEIVDMLEEVLKPQAIGLIMRASHSCKELRGVKKSGVMSTSVLRGLFREEPETRAEFMSLSVDK